MEKLRRILVVDGSRVVRATLTKHLQDEFEIREESNGESAWQTLVLDSSIAVVISSVHTPKLEAQGLLQRLRSSSLRRLNELPFLLIASDTDQRIQEEAARQLGISGFIKKTMRKAEILERLQVILNPLFDQRLPRPARRPRSQTRFPRRAVITHRHTAVT